MKIRLIMLQSIIMTVWTGLSAQESNRYLVIVTSAECYSQPAAGSAEKGDPLPFGSVIFSDSVIRRDNDFDYIKTVHPRSGDTVYVPYEMTMKSRKVTVERSGDTVTLEGVSGSPYFHVPHDLVMLNPRYTLGGRAVYARKSATDDLYAMMDDAREDGHTLLIARGYDDLAKRIQVYEDAVRKDPKQTEVKKPLSSEYGSGLHFDITDSKAEDDYRHYVMDQQAWEWLDANIGEYGFERSGPHYLLVYTGKKKKTQHAKGAAFPDNIDRKVKFGSICTIHILKKSNFQYASYVWVHHNEKSGGKTMHYALDTYGGHSVYIINKNRRNLYIDYGRRHFAVDPNRIFTDKGID
ncbi:MAG: D-alanyl-D-alanine carboxypeptidase family protein, partial [Spirochaetota bacterium]